MRLRTPEGELAPTAATRRAALGLFTAGYALAGAGATAQPITTPADGLIEAEITYPGDGGYALPAYVARPDDRARHAAVIVVNEIFGIHGYIKDVCRRLARLGYVAIAPDYFDRAGDPATLTDMAAIRPIVAEAKFTQVMGDTGGARLWLSRQRFAAADKIGITGFCWGGAVTWMAAAEVQGIKAGVAWYGRIVAPPADGFGAEAGRPWPVDVAARLKAPVLGLYAENDRGIPLDTVEAMRRALDAAGNPTGSRIHVYPRTQHGFHADYRDAYDALAAADGWGRMLAWFESHGVK